VLKNALDYLLPEYERKPIAIVTVSAGDRGSDGKVEMTRVPETSLPER
jgi:NAD(P)H-dependent FMN reductase